MRKYIEIGKIVNTHGVHGSVKVDPWCDTPQVLAQMKKVYLSPLAKGEAYRELTVLKGSVQKYHVLLTLEGIDTFDAAEAMKNTLLFADRDDIPIAEGAFLIDDLKGLPVTDYHDGHTYGILHDVIQGGAGDLYEIQTENGMVLVPAVKEFVKSVDLTTGIVLAPIRGMFDEN